MGVEVSFNHAEIWHGVGGTMLVLRIDNQASARFALSRIREDKQYVAEIKEKKDRRSLDANAYLWVLLQRLADAMTAEGGGDIAYSKEYVYQQMLGKYGQSYVVKIPNEHIEKFLREHKYAYQHETLPAEERAQYFKVLIGSSNYSTREMSVLINGVVAECKEQGIETMTPAELSLLLDRWEESK